MEVAGQLRAVVGEQRYPLLFATVSGAHLYGFPSPDSDYDLRGVHLLPLHEVIGLDTGPETIEVSRRQDGLDLDLVTHDARKFFGLLLKKNGYVLEQLYSPLVVHTTEAHEELKALAHVYRVLLTGIHLMRTGEVEANLIRLNDVFRLPQLPELIARKTGGPERATLDEGDVSFHQGEYERLAVELEDASRTSHLPEAPTTRTALHNLLVRLRLGGDARAIGGHRGE